MARKLYVFSFFIHTFGSKCFLFDTFRQNFFFADKAKEEFFAKTQFSTFVQLFCKNDFIYLH